MIALYKAFEDTDASLAEINPFLVTGDNKVYALDAKMNFDDNALYRHKDIRGTSRPQRRRTARNRSQQVRISTTSSSTATSPAWSTAPVLRWRRWTSSSSPAAVRRTSSTSVAAHRGAGEERVPHSALRQEREGGPDQHLRRHHAMRHRRDQALSKRRKRSRHQSSGGRPARRNERRSRVRRSCEDSGLNFIVADGMKDAAEKVVAAAKEVSHR